MPAAGARAPRAAPDVVGNNGAYDPSYLQSAYNTPSASGGSGQTIAIVDAYDNPNAEADLGTYRSNFGLPACTTANGCFRKVNQNGATSPLPAANASWGQEIALDLDMASAICPNCKILLVEGNSATFADLGAAENTAARLGANAISNSYGASEFSSEASSDSAYNHPGIAITVSSGDNGYGVEYPASSPNVTAVGGTSLTQATNTGTRNGTETAWSGAGSGCSAYEAKPTWQTDACGKRNVADVSAVADPNTGVWVYDSYAYLGQSGWLMFGGTSAAAPIVGAVYALAGNGPSTDNLASYPYGNPSALNDVLAGSNGTCASPYECTAMPAYDGPTGLGTPNGIGAFVFKPTPAYSMAVSPSSQNVNSGANASYTVNLTATNGYASPVTLDVTGLPAGASATFVPNPAVWTGSTASSNMSITTTAGTTRAGTYTLTVNGSGADGLKRSTTTTLVVVAPDFSMSASPTSRAVQGAASTTYAINLTATNGYNSPVTLSASGQPADSTVSFDPNPPPWSGTSASSTMTVTTASTTPAGGYTLTVTGAGSDGVTHTTTVTLTVNGDYALAASQPTITATRGSSGTDTIVLTTTDGYGSNVTLSLSGLPARTSANFNPNPVKPNSAGAKSTLTVTARGGATPGDYTLTVTGKGTDGTTHTTNITLSIR